MCLDFYGQCEVGEMRNFMKKAALWMISLLAAGVIVWICADGFSLFASKKAPEIVLLGDSIVGTPVDGVDFAECLEQAVGMTVQNGGFGGTCASYDIEHAYPADVSGQLSLAQISRAIAAGDFSVQLAQTAYGERYFDVFGQALEYFPGRVEELEQVDFKGVKYLVIEHGTNDYNKGVLVDNATDQYDETTFAGALRTSIERLQKAYPDLQILLMTPTWCCIIKDTASYPCDETDWGGGYLEVYAEAELLVAKEYDLPILDNYHESGIGRDTMAQFLHDGIHLSLSGQQLLAKKLADFILELEKE